MENQDLAAETSSVESKASYSIILFPGPALPEQYKGLIYSRWLKTLRQYNDYFRLIDKKAYYEVYPNYIGLLLNRPNTQVKIAVLSDDFDVALGFSVVEGVTLHYCHIQENYRNQKIGSALVPKDFQYITHLTKFGLRIWNKKYPHVKFNPFI